LEELARLLLPEHTHKSIYSWRIVVYLREIVIQEVHPRLTDRPLIMTRIAYSPKEGLGDCFWSVSWVNTGDSSSL